MSIAEAEVDLLSSHVFKTTFVKYKVSVLQVLCARHSITVTPTGRSSSPLKQDYVDALNTYKRTREAEARSSEQQLLEVHLIGGPKDWIVLKKIWYQWRTGEDIDLVALAGRFGEKNKLCYVIDPKNNRPFYQYVKGWLEADDVGMMTKDQVLRVIIKSMR